MLNSAEISILSFINKYDQSQDFLFSCLMESHIEVSSSKTCLKTVVRLAAQCETQDEMCSSLECFSSSDKVNKIREL